MSFQSKRLRLQLPGAETGFPADAADDAAPVAGDPWPDLGGGAGHDEFETVLVTPQQLAVLRRRLEARLAPATGTQGERWRPLATMWPG